MADPLKQNTDLLLQHHQVTNRKCKLTLGLLPKTGNYVGYE